jgi:hypothetical protein
MTEKLSKVDLRRYALLGAEARLVELGKEAAGIYQAFPELRKQGGARSLSAVPAATAARTGQRKRGRTMSAAQREEVRQRMKRYWAQRRNATTAAQAGEAADTAEGTPAASRTSRAGRKSGRRGRRKMSAAARKRISDAQKARWAKKKKASA